MIISIKYWNHSISNLFCTTYLVQNNLLNFFSQKSFDDVDFDLYLGLGYGSLENDIAGYPTRPIRPYLSL